MTDLNKADLKDELKEKTDKLVSQDKELFANLSKEEITKEKKERAKKFREENKTLIWDNKIYGKFRNILDDKTLSNENIINKLKFTSEDFSKNENLHKAKELNEDWFKNAAKSSHVDLVSKNGLLPWARFPFPEISRLIYGASNTKNIDELIAFAPKLKNYLEETKIHEYSGAIYGDYMSLIAGIKNNMNEFEHMEIRPGIVYSEIPKGEIVLSGVRGTIYYNNWLYYVVSDSSYYTGCTGWNPYKILVVSDKPIRLEYTIGWSVDNHARGYIKLAN